MLPKLSNNPFHKLFLFGAFTLFFHNSYSQTFVFDKQGFVSDPNFQSFIANRHYELVSAFDTLRKNPTIIGAKVMLQGKWRVIDNHGKLLTDEEVNYRANLLSGGGDSFGEPTIPYDDTMDKDPYKQVNINGRYGTVNKKTGSEGIPAIYDGLSFFSGGLVEIRSGEKLGLAFSSGKIIRQPQYDQMNSMVFDFKAKDGIYIQTTKDGKYGLINSKGDEVIAPAYDQMIRDCTGCDISKNLLLVAKDKKWGIVSKTGKLIVAPTYDQIRPLTFKGQMTIQTGTGADLRYGLIDSTGKVLMQPVYNQMRMDFSAKLIVLTLIKEGKTNFGLADANGKIILPAEYQYIAEFRNGLAAIKKDNKFGVIASTGKIILEPVYDHVNVDPTSAWILVYKDAKCGAVDLKGAAIIPVVNDELLIDNSKRYAFRKDDKWGKGVIGIKGTSPLAYEQITASNNYLVVVKDGKSGVIDLSGKIIFPIKYDKFRNPAHVVESGLARAVLNGKDYVIDRYENEYLWGR